MNEFGSWKEEEFPKTFTKVIESTLNNVDNLLEITNWNVKTALEMDGMVGISKLDRRELSIAKMTDDAISEQPLKGKT